MSRTYCKNTTTFEPYHAEYMLYRDKEQERKYWGWDKIAERKSRWKFKSPNDKCNRKSPKKYHKITNKMRKIRIKEHFIMNLTVTNLQLFIQNGTVKIQTLGGTDK